MSGTLTRVAWMLCVSVLSYGCATPRPVLDLASRGVGAATLAEAELQRYVAASQDQLSARLVIVRQLSIAELEENYNDAFSKFLKEKAGDRSGTEVRDLIRTLGEERRRLREQTLVDIAKLDERSQQALGDPVRPPAEAFAATRRAFTTLAQELSPQEWLALTAVYARAISETVKQIREEEKKTQPKADSTN